MTTIWVVLLNNSISYSLKSSIKIIASCNALCIGIFWKKWHSDTLRTMLWKWHGRTWRQLSERPSSRTCSMETGQTHTSHPLPVGWTTDGSSPSLFRLSTAWTKRCKRSTPCGPNRTRAPWWSPSNTRCTTSTVRLIYTSSHGCRNCSTPAA